MQPKSQQDKDSEVASFHFSMATDIELSYLVVSAVNYPAAVSSLDPACQSSAAQRHEISDPQTLSRRGCGVRRAYVLWKYKSNFYVLYSAFCSFC